MVQVLTIDNILEECRRQFSFDFVLKVVQSTAAVSNYLEVELYEIRYRLLSQSITNIKVILPYEVTISVIRLIYSDK